MTNPKAVLASTSKEIRDLARVIRGHSERDIILAPVDFSDHSEAALIQAAAFAEMMPATLIVLHVVHDPGEMPGYYAKLIKKKKVVRIQDIAADAFDEFMDDVVEDNPGLDSLREADRLMVTGLPVTRILELVEYLEPIMVVMGSQGRTGLKHLVIGSKATQIVQLCPVPVTIVKKPGNVD
jgi:nucleotide-binding universal stress UspA family protein